MPTPRRFDLALMQPPDAAEALDAPLAQRVRAWCEAGARPRMTEPLAFAIHAPAPGFDAAACALDGSHALARIGRWRGLAWRLRVAIDDRSPARAPRPGDPWDCGWWRDDALAAARAFRPRRPTLLLVRERDIARFDPLQATLAANAASFARPVRVLLLARLDGGPGALPVSLTRLPSLDGPATVNRR